MPGKKSRSRALHLQFVGLIAIGAMATISRGSAADDPVAPLPWSSFTVSSEPLGADARRPVVTSISAQPNGSLVAVAGDNHAVSLFDASSGRFVHHLTHHTDWVRVVRFSPDGRWLTTAGNDRQIVVWEVGHWDQPRTLARHAQAIADLTFSSDSRHVAAVGFEKTLRVYEVETGRVERELECPCIDMRAVAITEDRQWIAAGGRNGIIRLWDGSSGRVNRQWEAHSQRVRALEFTPDGQLVSVGDDGAVRLSDVSDPAGSVLLGRVPGRAYSVKLLDRDLLAVGGSDNLIYVWDLRQRKRLGVLRGHTGTVASLDYQNNVLFSGGFDATIRLWTTEKIAGVLPPLR